MRWVAVLVAIAVGACGRIDFDALDDAGTGEPRSIELPPGGQMLQVIVDRVAGGGQLWYALGGSGVGFRSTDKGATWTRCGDREGTSLAVMSDGTVWMSGTDVGTSTDQCATWTDTGNPRFSDHVFAEGTSVWAQTDQGLRSWNGTSWAVVATPVGLNRFLWMSKGPSRYFIGTATQGVLTSPDAVTWTQSPMGGLASNDVNQVGAGAAHAYAITAGTSHNTACSDQTGAAWVSCFGVGGLTITVDPADDQHVFAGIYDDLAETTDAFGSVTRNIRELSMDAAIVHDIKFQADRTLIAATDRGVFVAPAGSNLFEPRNTGLNGWDIDRMLVDGDDMWLATRGGVLHSHKGAPFTISTTGIITNTVIRGLAVLPDGRLLAGGRGLELSSDRGDSWSVLYDAQGQDGYYASAMAVVGSRLFVGTATRLLHADPPYTTFTPQAFASGNRAVVSIHATANKLFVGTSQDLQVSADGGATFQPVAALGTPRVAEFIELADGSLAAATSDGVWLSDASTSSWQRAGLMGKYVDGITLVPGDTWIAATSTGVRYTRDHGVTWTPLPGAENFGASATVVDDTTGQLIVGTDSRGLIRVPLP